MAARPVAYGSVCILLGFFATPVEAQNKLPQHWGVTVSAAEWRADDTFKGLYNADGLDFSGSVLRLGITRGSTRGREAAFTFVRKTIVQGSRLVSRKGEVYEIGSGVTLTGFMAEKFLSFGTIGNRVQLGPVIAAGVAKVKGRATLVPGTDERELQELLTFFAKKVNYHPLARAEFAAAIIAAPGVKIRLSGGFDWPGTSTLSVTALYFFGDR